MGKDRSDYYFNLHRSLKRSKVSFTDLSIDPFSVQENEFESSKDFSKWSDISYEDISNGQIFHIFVLK